MYEIVSVVPLLAALEAGADLPRQGFAAVMGIGLVVVFLLFGGRSE